MTVCEITRNMTTREAALEEKPIRWSLGEFFVMRKYRRQGIGEYAAACVFDLWPGKWEVNQIAAHSASTDFWRKVIGRYTHGQYAEQGSHQGPTQLFDNSDYAPASK